MAGAIAGSAILRANKLTEGLHTITLTINNKCNLKCPHCYLNYDSNKTIIENSTLESVFSSKFKHLAIVGQEPLLNKESRDLLINIIHTAKEKDLTISLITNGLNLHQLPKTIFPLIDYIDVSFDGGPETYQKYRKAKFEKVISGIEYAISNGLKEVNALHTINSTNITEIDDMIKVQEFIPFNKMLFSPYLITENFGINYVDSINLYNILNKVAKNSSFQKSKIAYLLIDIFHLWQEKTSAFEFNSKINELNIQDKVHFFELDPVLHGIIRVTFDDLVMTPYQSLHPKLYNKSKSKASKNNLNQIYKNLILQYESNQDRKLELSI